MPGRYRYWDGARWTEHLAAPPAQTPPPPPVAPFAPQPFAGFGTAPTPPHVTLYNNPHQLSPRTRRRMVENNLSSADRVRAAAIDAALVIPFVVLGFVLGPLLGWISGNSDSQHHAYRVAGIVLAVILGLGVMAWNFLIRETTIGTALITHDPENKDSEVKAP